MDKKIFISYCWKNYNIVDIIDSDFKSIGITLIRDIRDLKPYESLKEFMKKIREADFVISVISEHYLKSFNCMYEIKELIKDDEYNKKIFPIVIKDENFDIYNSNSDINIITYWEKEYDNHNKKIKKLKSEQNKIEPLERLREIQNISNSIGSYIKIVKDLNSPSFDELKKNKYKPILDKIGYTNLESDIIVKLIKIQHINNKEEQDIQIDELIKKYPNNKYIYFTKGYIEGQRGEFKKAIIDYSYSIDLDPNYAYPYINRGVIYGKQYEETKDQKYYDLAINDLIKAKELNPQYIETYNNLGNIYRLHRNYDLAEKEINIALSIDPSFISAYNTRGLLYEWMNLFDKAITDYTKAIEINPNYLHAYNNRGVTYCKQKKYDLAEIDFKKAIEIDPDDIRAYINLIKLSMTSEKFDSINEYLRKAFEIDPNCKEKYFTQIKF